MRCPAGATPPKAGRCWRGVTRRSGQAQRGSGRPAPGLTAPPPRGGMGRSRRPLPRVRLPRGVRRHLMMEPARKDDERLRRLVVARVHGRHRFELSPVQPPSSRPRHARTSRAPRELARLRRPCAETRDVGARIPGAGRTHACPTRPEMTPPSRPSLRAGWAEPPAASVVRLVVAAVGAARGPAPLAARRRDPVCLCALRTRVVAGRSGSTRPCVGRWVGGHRHGGRRSRRRPDDGDDDVLATGVRPVHDAVARWRSVPCERFGDAGEYVHAAGGVIFHRRSGILASTSARKLTACSVSNVGGPSAPRRKPSHDFSHDRCRERPPSATQSRPDGVAKYMILLYGPAVARRRN